MSNSVKIVSFLIVVFSFLMSYFKSKPYNELLEIDSCPFCYGTSLCQTFFRDQIVVKNSATLFKAITYTTNFLGINNVIFASLDDRSVVIKKLAQYWEFHEFDNKMTEDDYCDLITEEDVIIKMKHHLNVPFGTTLVNRNIRLCPTVDKFDLLYNSLKTESNNNYKDSYINLWFTLIVSPEPLIQKILPREDGWPVPRYVGSCGRTVVSDFCGEMLTDRVQDSFQVRADISYQLLTAAFNFTYKHPLFAFYLTDVIPDNIAVTSDGEICFIDLENIIIVERNTSADFVPNWSDIHCSDNIECNNCFAFSSDDICSHSISDHNVYAVCKEILNPHSYLIDGGLLHSPSETFMKHNPQFWTVILHCIQPPKDRNRFYYAKQLMRILKNSVYF